eukprot:362104-Chlamydomonas_euryale.AAC.2
MFTTRNRAGRAPLPHRCAVEWRLHARSGGALAGPDGCCCAQVPHIRRGARMLCGMGPFGSK